MKVVVPFDVQTPKTRLSARLSSQERRSFGNALLADVTTAIETAGHAPEILATDQMESQYPVTVSRRPLTAAVNTVLHQRSPPIAVLMADLGLVTAKTVDRIFEPSVDVVLAPGRGGGTNAFLTRHPEFRVDYHGGSLQDHRKIANSIGASVTEVDSFRLATDIDEPADLIEVLLHTDGRAKGWLQEKGFQLESDASGLKLIRSNE